MRYRSLDPRLIIETAERLEERIGERFPEAQFVITGVLGPGSNAHGPNEFLHVPTGVRVTACVAEILADHHRHASRP